MANVYIVQGETGEYSDRTEWAVAAYLHEDDAKEHVRALDAWLGERKQRYNCAHVCLDRRRLPKCTLDPHFQCDYTGTRYYYYAVELKDSFVLQPEHR